MVRVPWLPIAVLLLGLLVPQSARGAPRKAPDIHAPSTNPLLDSTRPLFFRSAGSTTWVHVGGNCQPGDTTGSPPGQTAAHIWCFDDPTGVAEGDSSWPGIPPGQDNGSRHSRWDHWSRFAPPGPHGSAWHVTSQHGGATTGTYNAWCGCDGVGSIPPCSEVGWWTSPEGYGDEWSYPLVLEMSGQDASAGGVIRFDLRYDAEPDYDFLFLEIWDDSLSFWVSVMDSTGAPAAFTGSSSWVVDATFPLPAQSGDVKLRWRGYSDPAASDADGAVDTNGLAALDNVHVKFLADGAVVSDDFESGDFGGVTASLGTAVWAPGALAGDTYDGWHLEFDPKYKNKGWTCEFTNDWMWAARPNSPFGPIPANGFDFFLVTPVVDVSGWTGGVVEYATAHCTPEERSGRATNAVRTYDPSRGWSPWREPGAIRAVPGCLEFATNEAMDLSLFLGPAVDSIQIAWRMFDDAQPGDLTWGQHQLVQYVLDNVSVGRFDGGATLFVAQDSDLFADTFSQSDPAHSAALANAEQGNWIGTGGSRPFSHADSLTVLVRDPHGVTQGNVALWWRHDDGGVAFGPWHGKPMVLAEPWLTSGSDEGLYRSSLGADDGGSEDLTPGGDGRIWKPGTTVEYYVRVVDDLANAATFPLDVGAPFEFSVLPFFRTSAAQDSVTILLVDGFRRKLLDIEESEGFDPNGAIGGFFQWPAFDFAADMFADELDRLYLVYDRYDVHGAGSAVRSEPRAVPDTSRGLGGYLDPQGAPAYDIILWVLGDLGTHLLADTTRLELGAYLDAGGKLLIHGDDLARWLGEGGSNADSSIRFLETYLGATYPPAEWEFLDKVLDIVATGPWHCPMQSLHVYGECPGRRYFDRALLATPAPGSSNMVLYTWANGASRENGLPALIENRRVEGGGIAVFAPFDLSAISRWPIYPWFLNGPACLLRGVLEDRFGLALPPGASYCPCVGLSAPQGLAGAGISLAIPRPTPFGDEVTIAFQVPAPERVTITVHDVAGRRVATLLDGPVDAGPHQRIWDGRDASGHAVASGIYFVRMRADGFSQVRKLVRLR